MFWWLWLNAQDMLTHNIILPFPARYLFTVPLLSPTLTIQTHMIWKEKTLLLIP